MVQIIGGLSLLLGGNDCYDRYLTPIHFLRHLFVVISFSHLFTPTSRLLPLIADPRRLLMVAVLP